MKWEIRQPSIKDCKKVTPDNKIKSGDYVMVNNQVSTVNQTELNGILIFDSYDAYDDTFYVKQQKNGITYNVSKVQYSPELNLKKK